MAEVMIVAGMSGTGKTTSLRNIDPKRILYFDCDMKNSLPFSGWKKNFIKNENMFSTSNIESIKRCMAATLLPRPTGAREDDPTGKAYNPNIDIVCIDTINAIMNDMEMVEFRKNGASPTFSSWMDLARGVYELGNFAKTKFPPNIKVILFCHVEWADAGDGTSFLRIQTNGRKLDKINLASIVNIALITKCVRMEDESGKEVNRYVFETQSNRSFAKTPMGMFDTFEIENDLNMVLQRYEEWQLNG